MILPIAFFVAIIIIIVYLVINTKNKDKGNTLVTQLFLVRFKK